MTNRKSCVLKISLMLVSGIVLTACSAYQEHFKCKAQSGLGCSSVTEVNNLVNQGWPAKDARKKESNKKRSFFERLFKPKKSKKESVFGALFKCKGCKNAASDKHHPNALRIWIAPHGSQNQYRDEQFIYSVPGIGSFDSVNSVNTPEAPL